MRIVLREIDFKLKIYQQETYNQKKKWLNLQLQAERDADVTRADKEVLEKYEARQREIREQDENK